MTCPDIPDRVLAELNRYEARTAEREQLAQEREALLTADYHSCDFLTALDNLCARYRLWLHHTPTGIILTPDLPTHYTIVWDTGLEAFLLTGDSI